MPDEIKPQEQPTDVTVEPLRQSIVDWDNPLDVNFLKKMKIMGLPKDEALQLLAEAKRQDALLKNQPPLAKDQFTFDQREPEEYPGQKKITLKTGETIDLEPQPVGTTVPQAGERFIRSFGESGQNIQEEVNKAKSPRADILDLVLGMAGAGGEFVGATPRALFSMVDPQIETAVNKMLDVKPLGSPYTIKESLQLVPPEIIQGLVDLKNKIPESIRSKTESAGRSVGGVLEASVALEGLLSGARALEKKVVRPILRVAEENVIRPLGAALDTKAIAKAEKQISKEVDNFLSSNKTIMKKVSDIKKKNVDLDKYLKDPEIFTGLKVANGRLDPADSLAVIETRLETLNDIKSEILPIADDIASAVSKETLRDRAYASIGNVTEADRIAIQKRIDKQLEAMADEFLPSDLDAARARFRKSSRDAKGIMKSSSEYAALENATRDLVFEIIDALPPNASAGFVEVNKAIKELLTTMEFLESVKGSTVTAGKMTKLINQITGAVAGSSFGPLGAIGGAEIGNIISNILANKQLEGAVKGKMIAKLMGDSPESIKIAKDILTAFKEYEKPQLPSSSPGAYRSEITSGPTIELPAKSSSAVERSEIERLSK